MTHVEMMTAPSTTFPVPEFQAPNLDHHLDPNGPKPTSENATPLVGREYAHTGGNLDAWFPPGAAHLLVQSGLTRDEFGILSLHAVDLMTHNIGEFMKYDNEGEAFHSLLYRFVRHMIPIAWSRYIVDGYFLPPNNLDFTLVFTLITDLLILCLGTDPHEIPQEYIFVMIENGWEETPESIMGQRLSNDNIGYHNYLRFKPTDQVVRTERLYVDRWNIDSEFNARLCELKCPRSFPTSVLNTLTDMPAVLTTSEERSTHTPASLINNDEIGNVVASTPQLGLQQGRGPKGELAPLNTMIREGVMTAAEPESPPFKRLSLVNYGFKPSSSAGNGKASMVVLATSTNGSRKSRTPPRRHQKSPIASSGGPTPDPLRGAAKAGITKSTALPGVSKFTKAVEFGRFVNDSDLTISNAPGGWWESD